MSTGLNLYQHLKNKATLYDFCFLYVFFGGLICSLFVQSEFLKSIISLPSFFFGPLLLGKVIDDVVESFRFRFFNRARVCAKGEDAELFSCVVYQFLLGIYSTLILVFSLRIISLFQLIKNLHFAILAVIVLDLLFIRRKNDAYFPHLSRSLKIHIPPLILMFLFCIFSFLIKMNFVEVPLPVFSGWNNLVETAQPAFRMMEKGIVVSLPRSVNFLYMVFACSLFNTDPVFFVYSGTLILTLVYAAGIYFLTCKFSSNVFLSMFSGILGIFLNAGIPAHNIPYYQFKSSSILASLYPWVLLMVIEKAENKYCSLKKTFLFVLVMGILSFSLFMTFSLTVANLICSLLGITLEFWGLIIKDWCILSFPLVGILVDFKFKNMPVRATLLTLISVVILHIHSREGMLCISSLLFLIFFCQILKRENGERFVRIFSSSVFFFILLVWTGVWNIPIPISSLVTSFPLPSLSHVINEKKTCLITGNGTILLCFTILGTALSFFSKNKYNLLALSALSYASFLYFFPDYFMTRAINLLTPFMALFISQAMFALCNIMGYIFSPSDKIVSQCKCTLSNIIVILLVIVLVMSNLPISTFTKFSLDRTRSQAVSGLGSRMTMYEYEAGVWLRENTEETDVIISDYWTMMLLNQVSNKIWITEKSFVAWVLPQTNKNLLFYIKNAIFKANDSDCAYRAIRNLPNMLESNIHWTERYYLDCIGIDIKDLKFLLVVSPRTIAWMERADEHKFVHDQWYLPFSSIKPQNLDIFNDSRFELIYRIPEKIYVFRVSNET